MLNIQRELSELASELELFILSLLYSCRYMLYVEVVVLSTNIYHTTTTTTASTTDPMKSQHDVFEQNTN